MSCGFFYINYIMESNFIQLKHDVLIVLSLKYVIKICWLAKNNYLKIHICLKMFILKISSWFSKLLFVYTNSQIWLENINNSPAEKLVKKRWVFDQLHQIIKDTTTTTWPSSENQIIIPFNIQTKGRRIEHI